MNDTVKELLKQAKELGYDPVLLNQAVNNFINSDKFMAMYNTNRNIPDEIISKHIQEEYNRLGGTYDIKQGVYKSKITHKGE